MKAQSDLGKFQVSILSTNAPKDEFLVNGDYKSIAVTVETVEEDYGQILNNLFAMSTDGDVDIDKIMVSASHAGKSK